LYLFQRLWEDLAKYTATPRRDWRYWSIVLTSGGLAIASDFLGVMRFLLSLNPEAARQAGLDQVYEVGGLKSFRRPGKYELRYPGQWIFDQSVAFSQQAGIEMSLRKRRAIIPDAAFGPPGGGVASEAKRENLSVVVQPIPAPGLLEDILGNPEQAFQRLVREKLAPEGSGRSVELLSAGRRPGRTSQAGAFEFEYLVVRTLQEGKAVFHTWSAVAIGQGEPGATSRPLYTMTLVAPEASLTPERQRVFTEAWRSFEVEP